MDGDSRSTYFALQASWGVTKHLGGQGATDELARMCHLQAGSRVLVVGCGAGMSACYLAVRFGAKVAGVDISPAMVRQSAKRAHRQGLTDEAVFLVGSATALPFDDAAFDAVLCESVNSFIPERVRSLAEYRRVVRPGGRIGMNECVWLDVPPRDLADYLEGITGAHFMDARGGWGRLLEEGGLDLVSQTIHQTGILRQWFSEARQADARDFASAWVSFARGCLSNTEYRRFALAAFNVPRSAWRMFRYFGYGIYVGRKPGPEGDVADGG